MLMLLKGRAIVNGMAIRCAVACAHGSSQPLCHPRAPAHEKKDRKQFAADAGTGYCFSPDEEHGAELPDDSAVIECFASLRPDYMTQ